MFDDLFDDLIACLNRLPVSVISTRYRYQTLGNWLKVYIKAPQVNFDFINLISSLDRLFLILKLIGDLAFKSASSAGFPGRLTAKFTRSLQR